MVLEQDPNRRDLTELEKRQAVEARWPARYRHLTEQEKAQAYRLYREKHEIK